MHVHETEARLDINHNNDTRDELAEASTGDWYDNLEVRNHCLPLSSLIHPCQPLLWDVPYLIFICLCHLSRDGWDGYCHT